MNRDPYLTKDDENTKKAPNIVPHLKKLARGGACGASVGLLTAWYVPMDPILLLNIGAGVAASIIIYVRSHHWHSVIGFYGWCSAVGVALVPSMNTAWPWKYTLHEAFIAKSIKLAFLAPMVLLFLIFVPLVGGYVYHPTKARNVTLIVTVMSIVFSSHLRQGLNSYAEMRPVLKKYDTTRFWGAEYSKNAFGSKWDDATLVGSIARRIFGN